MRELNVWDDKEWKVKEMHHLRCYRGVIKIITKYMSRFSLPTHIMYKKSCKKYILLSFLTCLCCSRRHKYKAHSLGSGCTKRSHRNQRDLHWHHSSYSPLIDRQCPPDRTTGKHMSQSHRCSEGSLSLQVTLTMLRASFSKAKVKKPSWRDQQESFTKHKNTQGRV